jgi:hypothetical protein
MSEVKVNKISPRTNCGTVQLGDSGDTITIPAGATITNNGTQTGFGRSGTVNWQTTKKTTDFTAANGEGYFVDTAASGAVAMTLPASPSAGDIVAVKDYNLNFATANLTINRNGEPINGGSAINPVIDTDGASIVLVYVDGTQGWLATQDDSSILAGASFIVATGGTTADCGTHRTHIFTGPGTFSISQISSSSPNNKLDYLVVAGGGSGGSSAPAGSGSGTGGGGAGGFRLANSIGLPAPTMSPLANPSGLTATVASFPITVGGGAATAPPGNNAGNNGNPSVFSTITSTAGGAGGATPTQPGATGGSGGGGGYVSCGGAGNTPPVTPSQGNAGGNPTGGGPQFAASGGGGAGAAGSTNPAHNIGGVGGAGSFISNSFIGPTAPSYGTTGPVSNTRYFAGGGGGGGGIDNGPPGTGGLGGDGGGAAGGNSGSGAPASQGGAGATNTGGGGGGSAGTPSPANGGGSGIVMIRYRFQ